MITSKVNIAFREFEDLSVEQWKDQIVRELKGKPFENVIWKNEDFDVEPFYRNDCKSEFPNEWATHEFIRNGLDKDWHILQEFGAGNNQLILEALNNGCSSLRIISNAFNFEQDLKGVMPDLIQIHLPELSIEDLEAFSVWAKHSHSEFHKLKGGINYYPLSEIILSGVDNNAWQSQLNEYVKATQNNPIFRILNIKGTVFEEGGATSVQQLAFSISQGVEYLNHLQENRKAINELATKLLFEMSVGSSYFIELAKLRALRILWARVLNAFGLRDHHSLQTYIIGSTSRFMCGSGDYNTNLIRNTTACMSAVLGNCDEILIQPHDGLSSQRSLRLARNIQNLLKEEAFLNRVVDPSFGSYYVENLTHNMVKHAWDLFMKIESSGGYLENIKNGHIQSVIKDQAAKKIDVLNSGAAVRIGNNKYLKPEDSKKTWVLEKNDKVDVEPLQKIKCI